MSLEGTLDRKTLDQLLNELAKDLKRSTPKGQNLYEIVIVGGASIVINHDFRPSTRDVDAWFLSSEILISSIRQIGKRYGLSERWLNADFVQSKSFSKQLREVSVYYKTFQRILEVRVVRGADLIAMKLVAGRKYKNDLSDIVGILMEYDRQGEWITLEMINESIIKLYGSTESVEPDLLEWIVLMLTHKDYLRIYDQVLEEEDEAKTILIERMSVSNDIQNEEDALRVLDLIKQKQIQSK